MVYIAPPLKAVLEIKLEIENGSSIAESIRIFYKKNPGDFFAKELQVWLSKKEAGQNWSSKTFAKIYRKTLLDLLDRGLKGEPILERLQSLEEDLCLAAKEDLQKHLQKLPFISLIPLMIFEFPAFLLLLIGPLVLNLVSLLQGS